MRRLAVAELDAQRGGDDADSLVWFDVDGCFGEVLVRAGSAGSVWADDLVPAFSLCLFSWISATTSGRVQRVNRARAAGRMNLVGAMQVSARERFWSVSRRVSSHSVWAVCRSRFGSVLSADRAQEESTRATMLFVLFTTSRVSSPRRATNAVKAARRTNDPPRKPSAILNDRRLI